MGPSAVVLNAAGISEAFLVSGAEEQTNRVYDTLDT